MNGWFYSRKLVFFVLAGITAVICAGAFQIELGIKADSKNDVFTVEFDWYGMDSSKIENSITIPLEQKLMGLEGLLDLTSTSEYGKAVSTLYFKKNGAKSAKNTYLSIRNIVDTLYRSLPDDVQKPRIYSSDSNSKSVLSIAFYDSDSQTSLRDLIESTLKKKLEGVDGVAEVLVTGGLQKEILVSFSPEKSASSLQNPSDFSTAIQDANSVTPGSEFRNKNEIVGIRFDTKIKGIDELKDVPLKVGEGYTKLKFLADVSFSGRDNEELVRIDGKDAVVVSVKADSNGNSIKISKEVRKILGKHEGNVPEHKILYDEGERQLKLLRKVLFSLFESLVCVFIVIPLFYMSFRTTGVVVCLLCLNSIWTIGALKVLGYTLNQNTIAGLSIALGLIADPALVIAEKAETCSTFGFFIKSLKSVFPSLVSACFTTILVLLPLFYLEPVVSGTKAIAVTVAIMILSSIVLSMLFVPPFIYAGRAEDKNFMLAGIVRKIRRFYVRFGYRLSFIALKNSTISVALYAVFLVVPVVIFVLSGKNISFENSSNILYCSVDYDSETTSSYIDNELLKITNILSGKSFVDFVRTETRKGSADIEIGFKNLSRKDVASYVSSLGKLLPDGFLYVPESSPEKTSGKKRKKIASMQIACLGDESDVCRRYCEDAAKQLSSVPFCSSVVLNFKKAESEYVFFPDREKCVKNNVSVQSLASSLRWFMFGPVADKWISDGKEYDIRIAGEGLRRATIEKIENLHVPAQNTAIKFSSLGKINLEAGNGKVFRKNGRRCAYFTVETAGLSTDRAVSLIKSELSNIKLDFGYGFSFPREIEESSDSYRLIFAMFLISTAGIFLLLTFLTEKPLKSLIIISVIPISLVLPLALKAVFLLPLELGDVVGMIVLSGIVVNNSIYLAESNKSKICFRVRDKIKSILVTSLTTIAGSVPLYFISADSFSKSLSFFMIFGIIGSLFATLLLFPALLRTYHPSTR